MTHIEADVDHLEERDVELARHMLVQVPGGFAHATRVADRVRTFGAAQVALFHDVLEDTAVDPYLLSVLLGRGTMASVVTLTRSYETYAEYIDRILMSADTDAVAVKLADLYDHLDPSMADTLRPSLRLRYEKAVAVLLPKGKYLMVRKHLRIQP